MSRCRVRNCSLLFVLTNLFAMAGASKAAIILSATNLTYLDQDLFAFTLHAHSTSPNQTIDGVDTPSLIGPNNTPVLHQVWTPITNSPTPTRGSQTSNVPQWSDSWQPYDSYWLFGIGDSLAIAAPLNETNNGTGGAILPSAGFGPPTTGLGVMGTVGNAGGAAAFTLSSGKIGADVDLAHLVLKLSSNVVFFSGQILTAQGNNQTFSNFAFSLPEPASVALGYVLISCLGFVRRPKSRNASGSRN